MKNSINSKSNFKDIGLWAGVVIITVAAFLCTYHFNFSAPIKAIIWIVWFVLAIFLAYFTTTGRQVFAFVGEAKIELLKVVWPTRQETIQTTSIVMVMVAVTGFVLWAIDSGMMWVIAKITHLG
ncbi:preprotein translocase subunit SecE [Legionella beliardensis]|uniref:preprotein translocase subunit SecE n=1 Tax=Legionella beliardensis TaxID=91822 RepID=UPI000E1C04F1|nr:preprotein translocase subunit SecE [Legionella beliardensis]